MKPQQILIVGATSAIAQAVAREFARRGAHFFLVGRNAEKLTILSRDLTTRGAGSAHTYACELAGRDCGPDIVARAYAVSPRWDLVLMAQGTMGEGTLAESDFAQLQSIYQVGFFSIASVFMAFVPRLRAQKGGTLAVISSVAGDRGKASNFVYGSTKAALSCYLQGWRQKLSKDGVRVVTIKPGPVDTPMTTGMKKGLLMASPEKVGRVLYAKLLGTQDVVYVPGFWRVLMAVIALIPERVFKRLSM